MTPAPATLPPRGYAWYSVGALTLCYTLAFVDRQILGLLIGPIKAEFGISDTQVGLLGGFAFAIFYSVVSLPMGRLVDRLPRWRIIGLGVLFWSAMTMACAVARGYSGLFLARMGVGVGEAALAPAAVSAIADSMPPERLGSAMSVYGTGIYLGSGLALLLGGAVVAAIGDVPTLALPVVGDIASWRVTFLIVGAPGILAGLWVLSLREPPRARALVAADGAPARLTIRQTLAQIGARRGAVAGIAIGLMFQAIALYAYMLWAPEMLRRSYALAPATIGAAMGCVVLVGGVSGMLAGGWLSDRGLRTGRRDAALRVAGASSLAGGAVFAGLLVPGIGAPAALATLFAGVVLLAMPAGSCYAASQMILPNQVRGQATALILLIANFGGLTLGPLLPGLLTDRLFGDGGRLASALGLTLSAATLAAGVVFHAARASYRTHHAALDDQSLPVSSGTILNRSPTRPTSAT